MTLTTGLEDGILKKDVLGRVKTPRERREALLAEFDRSGMSGQKFAAWAGIKYATFAHWRQQRRKQEGKDSSQRAGKNPVRWLEAIVGKGAVEPGAAAVGGLIIEGPGGLRLEVRDEEQARLAGILLRHLQAAQPC